MSTQSRWLTCAGVGELLALSPRVVREQIAIRPDFPAPMRIGGTGHLRWREDEVQAWAEIQRQETAQKRA